MIEEITLDDILWQLEKHPIDSDYVFGCEEVKIIYDSIIKLEKENKQLKDNWNKLKEYIDIKLYNTKYLQNLCGCRIDDETHMILDIIKKEMQELEGSDNK